MLEVLPTKGNYTLIIALKAPSHVKISDRGRFSLKKGYYAYTGSARGNGAVGLRQRVARHLRKRKTKHWHIDYLLASQEARITAVIACSASASEECQISRNIQSIGGASIPIDGFGSSDCRQGCRSHLVYLGGNSASERVVAVHRRLAKKANVVHVTLDPRQK